MLLCAFDAWAQFTPTITQSGGPSGTVFPGTNFTMTATVSSAGPTPTGSLQFQLTDGGGNVAANLCNPGLTNGAASCNFNAPGNGSWRMRVVYSGDTFTAGGSQDFPFTSLQATPTIVESGGPSGTVLPGTNFTMVVTVLSPGPTPTGALQFQLTDGGGNVAANLCNPGLTNGTASCNLNAPGNGSWRMRVVYSGDTPTASGSQDFPFVSQQATPSITQNGGPSGTVPPGTNFTMTATVSSPGPTPTGSLNFQLTDGGGNVAANMCNPGLTNGAASCTFNAPANGSWRIRVVYSGDTPTAGGLQDFPFTAQQTAPIITQVGGPSGTVPPGTNFTMTATVSSPGPTPTGSLNFQLTDGGGNVAANMCNPGLTNGAASCNFNAPGNGSWRIRVVYSGDTFSAGTSQDYPFTSQQAIPVITQAGGPSGTVPPGTNFTMTATVSSPGPTPTGSLNFQLTDGGGNVAANMCNPGLTNGAASCNFNAPGNGSWRIRVVYSGDTFSAGTSQDFQFVSQQAAPRIAEAGGPSGTVLPGTNFTMAVTVLSPGPTPTGALQFQLTDGGGNVAANLCNPGLTNGSASCNFNAPGNGSWRMRVVYSGDTPTASGSQDFPFVSQQATPSITQSGGPAGTVLAGSSFTMTATVASPGPTPTGALLYQLTDGGGNVAANMCNPGLTNGTASCTFNAPGAGSWRIRVNYSGDTPTAAGSQDFAFTSSNAGTSPPPTLATPTISQTGAPSGTTIPGTSFTITATVSSTGPAPTGTVTFTLFASNGGNNGNLCTSVALSGGNASCAFSAPGSGSWFIRVSYSGDANTNSASQDYAFATQQVSPTIAQSGGPSGTVIPGTSFTMLATVSSSGPIPTGTVTFTLYQGNGGNNATLCSNVALSGGNGSCTFQAPAIGSWFIRVSYSGDTPTTSGTQDFAFNSQQATPTISQTGAPSGTVLPGTAFTMNATVASSGPTPTGTLTFTLYQSNGGNNGVLCAAVAMSSGSAGCAFVAPPNGSYFIRVTYSGDTATATGTHDYLFTSQQATPMITQTGGPTGATSLGTTFTMNAGVSSPGPTPTGTITFVLYQSNGGNNGTLCANVALSAGHGTCTFQAPGQGSWFIRVTYSGDTPTASGFQDFAFTSALATPTITQTGGPSGTVFTGSSFTMNAVVSSAGPQPTGNLTFTLFTSLGGNNGNLCFQVAMGGGGAACAFQVSTNGSWFIRVTYSGDSNTASGFQDFPFATSDATLSVSPASLTFAMTEVGTSSAAQTVTIANPSATTVNLSGISVPAGFSRTTTCGATLISHQSCTVDVSFVPSTAGTLNGTLMISDDAVGNPHTVSLAGAGALAPVIAKAFAPTTIVSAATSQLTITVSNFNPFPIDINLLDIYPSGMANAAVPNASTTCANGVPSAASGGGSISFSGSGSSVPTNGSCTVQVDVTAIALGSYTNTIPAGGVGASGGAAASYGSSTSAASATLTVSTIPVPAVLLSPSTINFGSVPVGSSAMATATLTNSGTATLNVTSLALPAQVTQSSACVTPYSLAPGGSCSYDFFFTPTGTGTFTGNAAFTSNAATSPDSILLSGNGTPALAPAVSFSPSSLSFAPQTVGTTSSPQNVTLTNSGTSSLSISSITISGDFAQSTTCGATLSPGGSCVMHVTFTPIASGGRVGQVVVSDDAAGSPHTVSLSGAGVAAPFPTIVLSAHALDFPDTEVGATSAPQLVSITNGGSVPLNLFSIGAPSQFPTTPACPATLAPGATCAVLVQFAPDVQGTITGTLAIESNAPSSPDSVALAGNGVPSPIGTLQARPAGLTFPGTRIGATSEAQTVTITNVGGAGAVIASVAADADFSVTGACTRLAPAASCSLAVSFSPSARGVRAGFLTLRSNASNTVLAVGLEGQALAPDHEATLDLTALAFGNQLQFVASPAKAVNLRNTGDAPLALRSIETSGPFTQANNCPAFLDPAASCRIDVRMLGTAIGPAGGELRVLSDAPAAVARLSGTTCMLFSLTRSRLGVLTCAP